MNLQHITPYLAHGVRFISNLDKPFGGHDYKPIWTLSGVLPLFGDFCAHTKENNDAYPLFTIKLLLRPLSDLTKEIEHNGNKFVPIDILGEDFGEIELNRTNENRSFYVDFESYKRFDDFYMIYNKLFEWHFDVFGLIETSQAVNINIVYGK